MTPEQLIEFNRMKAELQAIKSVRDLEFIEELKRRLGFSIAVEGGASLSGLTIAVRNASDTGSEVVADDYSGALTLTDAAGVDYIVGHYS